MSETDYVPKRWDDRRPSKWRAFVRRNWDWISGEVRERFSLWCWRMRMTDWEGLSVVAVTVFGIIGVFVALVLLD